MNSLKTKFSTRRELLRSILEHAAEAGVEAVGRGLIKEITQKEIAQGVRSVNAAGAGESRQPDRAEAQVRTEKQTDGSLASGNWRLGEGRHFPNIRGSKKQVLSAEF